VLEVPSGTVTGQVLMSTQCCSEALIISLRTKASTLPHGGRGYHGHGREEIVWDHPGCSITSPMQNGIRSTLNSSFYKVARGA
jgi:hypothetical protein